MSWRLADSDQRRLPIGKHGLVLWITWISVTMAGEVVGLAFVAATGWAVSMAFGTPAGIALLVGLGAMIMAGAVEGAAVGFAQSLVLCRELPAMSRRAWTRATMLGAAAAWMLGLMASTFAQGAVGMTERPNAAVVAAVAVAAGVVLGALLGAAQWLVLRRHVRRATSWVSASALAWAVALVAAIGGAWMVEPDTPVIAAAMAGALTGAGTGFIVGALTGLALVVILRHERLGATYSEAACCTGS